MRQSVDASLVPSFFSFFLFIIPKSFSQTNAIKVLRFSEGLNESITLFFDLEKFPYDPLDKGVWSEKLSTNSK